MPHKVSDSENESDAFESEQENIEEAIEIGDDSDQSDDNEAANAKSKSKSPTAKSSATPSKRKSTDSKSCASGSAPKKSKSSPNSDKKEVVKDSDAKKAILKYMQEQNRPYIHLNVFDNLTGKGIGVKKSYVAKALEELAAEGKLTEKINGKAKVYYAEQDSLEQLTPEQLAEIDKQCKQMEDEINQQNAQMRQDESDIKSIEATPTDSQLDSLLADAEKQFKAKSAQLHDCQTSSGSMTTDAIASIQLRFNNCFNEWKKRKTLCMDMLETVCENLSATPKKYMNDVGMESDEGEFVIHSPSASLTCRSLNCAAALLFVQRLIIVLCLSHLCWR